MCILKTGRRLLLARMGGLGCFQRGGTGFLQLGLELTHLVQEFHLLVAASHAIGALLIGTEAGAQISDFFVQSLDLSGVVHDFVHSGMSSYQLGTTRELQSGAGLFDESTIQSVIILLSKGMHDDIHVDSNQLTFQQKLHSIQCTS